MVLYGKTNRFEEAINVFNKGIKICPGFTDLYKNVGLVFKLKKDYLKAIDYWAKYVELSPNASDTELIKKSIENLKLKL